MNFISNVAAVCDRRISPSSSVTLPATPKETAAKVLQKAIRRPERSRRISSGCLLSGAGNPVGVKSSACLIIVLLLCFFSDACAQSIPPPIAPVPAAPTLTDPFNDPLIKQIVARHQKAVAGDTSETKSLTTDLEKWTKEQPDNHLLQAYLGSVYTLDSRDAWPGPGKWNYLQNGGKTLDAAVAAAPDNPAVRLVRAMDYFEIPAIFGKRQTARDDFQLLLKQIDGTVKSPYVLNLETRQAIYYYAGLSFQQLSQSEQAKATWEKGLKLDAKTAFGVKIQDELTKLE